MSESLGHLHLLPSVGKGRPSPVSSSTAVKSWATQRKKVRLRKRPRSSLACATLDPKHVDNLVHAVAQKGGSQMIRDLVAVCKTLSENFNVARRQTTQDLRLDGCAVSPLTTTAYSWRLLLWRHRWRSERFEEMKRVDCLDVVSFNTMLKARLNTSCLDGAVKLTQERCAKSLEKTFAKIFTGLEEAIVEDLLVKMMDQFLYTDWGEDIFFRVLDGGDGS